MPYVKRNTSGEITAVSQVSEAGFDEELNDRDPGLAVFMQGILHGKAEISESDLDFVRVVEDLVEVLIEKNYICFTDLPVKAQEKMRSRQSLRDKIHSKYGLLGDDEEGIF